MLYVTVPDGPCRYMWVHRSIDKIPKDPSSLWTSDTCSLWELDASVENDYDRYILAMSETGFYFVSLDM